MLESKREDIVISKIIENYRNGLWAIPEPLSGYAWEKQKNRAAMFIADLYLGWPVSSIVILESPDGQYATRNHTAWMLDGHQQIMALCKVMDKESDLRIVFNPRVTDTKKGSEGQFRVESARTRNSAGWIDVSKVLGSREDFYSVLREEPSEEHGVRLIRLREILNNKMPILKIIGYDYKTIIEAFMQWKMMKNLRRKGVSTAVAR